MLGGSFNPAHAGHRAVSLYALKRLGLDQVWWLVSPQNPLKPVKGMASLSERLAKAEAMTRHPRLVAAALESEFGTVFTVDTLKILQQRFPRAQFVWLIGADNMRHISRWKRWPELFARVPVAVFRRAPYAAGRGCGKAAQRFDRAWRPINQAKSFAESRAPAWMVLDNPLNPCSATQVRKDRSSWPK